MAEMENNEVMCCSTIDHNHFVMKNLQEQLVEGRNCDLEIRLRDNKLYVHKCLTDMFFTKIGAELENDTFYLDMTEFPQTIVAPLIDMMYHGILSVSKENIHDLDKFAGYVGFKQAQELIENQRISAAISFNPKQKQKKVKMSMAVKKPMKPVEVGGFLIKSEPPENENEEGVYNSSGYSAMGGPLSNMADTEPSTPKHIYEVFTPNPLDKDKNLTGVTSSWKLDENSSCIKDLIRDKDKAHVTVTDRPYETVSQILKLNELVVPKRTGESSAKKRKATVIKAKSDPMAGIDLSEVSIVHVPSPNPISHPKVDYINTKNFQNAAANRMLQSSIMNSLVSKAKKKTTPDGSTVKKLNVKARVKVSQNVIVKQPEKKSTNVTIKKEQETSVSETSVSHSEMRIRSLRKRHAGTTATERQSDSDDSEDPDASLDAYFKKGKSKAVKYFPPAGIVPDGCKSSYAESCFTKTRKITETHTNNRGDVMVVRKEVPVRRTIFNPNKNGPGIAAVVVCHPTKPVVRF